MPDGTDRSSRTNVVPFRGCPRTPISAAARLDQAIRALDQANSELRDTVAGWRAATTELSVSLGELAGSLQALEKEVTTMASRVQLSAVVETQDRSQQR